MSKVKSSAHSSEEASSMSGTSSSFSSDEEVDVRDLKSIKEYLSDRRELARQLFKSVKATKIEMMLPQSLKKMDFGQLERCCANELSGMSRKRILSIINGKPMIDSSNTSESDDSGPSLEIISDTEEWFTDEDMSKKEDGTKGLKGKIKKERIKHKGKSQIQKKSDNKVSNNVKVKIEEDVGKSKEKESDSLLDLLELEMRARAIRALIRKEDDIIPNESKSTNDNETLKENAAAAAKAEQDELKQKENCRRQLERIIGAQQTSVTEDEDVVLVVQPTPTIELLSSDSEGEFHGGVRVNKKLENERVIESEGNSNKQDKDSNNTHSLNNTENFGQNNVTENIAETHMDKDDTHKIEVSKRAHSSSESKDNQSKSSDKKRRTKKKSHAKEQSKNINSGTNNEKNVKDDNASSQSVKPNESIDNSLNKQNSNKASGTSSKPNLDEEKSIDLDEIIDLDNYDMDDIETSENDKNKKVAGSKQCNPEIEINSTQKSNGAETWASRYFQTDDVQNVIKDSKIQSEIRKRLRERQRLYKLNTNSNKNSPSPPLTETNDKTEKDPMGSVDEYMALKSATTAIVSINNSNDSGIAGNNAQLRSTNTNKSIENDRVSDKCSEDQKVEKEVNLSDDVSSLVATENKNAINLIYTASPS